MAKLPDNFVKAPAETSRVTTTGPAGKPAGKEVRRKARRGVLQPPAEAAEQSEVGGGDPAGSAGGAGGKAPRGIEQSDPHSVLVRLSPDEHQALSAACEALTAAGETVTIEDMIRKVIERWIAATRAAAAPEVPVPTPGAPAAPPRAIDAMPRAIDAIRTQLRWLAEQPVRRWRALRQALRRWSHALAG